MISHNQQLAGFYAWLGYGSAAGMVALTRIVHQHWALWVGVVLLGMLTVGFGWRGGMAQERVNQGE